MQEQFKTQPAGFLLNRFALIFMAACLLLAAWAGLLLIVVILGLLLSAAGLSWLWSRYSLAGVSVERRLSEHRIFPGESIELKLKLVNRKLLPLPWIQVDDEIPPMFNTSAVASGDMQGAGIVSRSAALLWYSSINWKQSLSAKRRGYYKLGPATVTSGDIFGFYPRSRVDPVIDRVIVYPRIFTIEQLGIPPMYPVGDTTAERRIFEDPVRIVGVRDYTPGDSRRRIHWKASARHNNLQVKVFEPTTSLDVAIFLAVDSFKARQGEVLDEEDFELAISASASLASRLIEQRSSVGMFVNSRLADSEQPIQMRPGSNAGQLVEILESLAKVTHAASEPFEDFFQANRVGLPWGTTFVFVLFRPSDLVKTLLLNLKESGCRLMVLQVGGDEESDIDGSISRYKVKQPGVLIGANNR
jgi:uncharacterized protein (DUF58 family)